MRVADTSALYAFFERDDAHHRTAVKEISRNEPIVVPSEILVETLLLIEYSATHEAARSALQDLLALPHVSIAEQVHVEAVQRIFEGAAGRLSIADAYVVQTCRALGAAPLTFDHQIRRAARSPK